MAVEVDRLAREAGRLRGRARADTPEEELKIAALQSLFRADADRGAAQPTAAEKRAHKNIRL